MRKLSLLLGLLLLPTMATGAVSINMVSGAYPGPYVSSLDGSGFAPGSQFTLWTVLGTDQSLDGMEYRIHVNGDADNDKFKLVGYALGALSFADPGGSLDGLGNAFNFFGDAWGTADYLTKKAPLPQGLDSLATSEVIFANTGLKTPAGVNGKTLIGYTIEATGSFVVGNYEFSALGPIGGGVQTALWTASGQSQSNGPIATGDSFFLTPEPTSALLLLVAVPFLRRRRA